MKVVIIEDEELVAQDLANSLKQLRPGLTIERLLGSVKEAVDYFRHHAQPDLIFSDIQLGDGLSFEISESIDVTAPIIFCTAYDEYAIEAFKVNGIEYILKPFRIDVLEKAIAKFELLKKQMTTEVVRSYEIAMKELPRYQLNNSDTFMVRYRDRHIPIHLDKIAFFHLDNEIIYLTTVSEQRYVLALSLDEVEKKVGNQFFRINRQFLVNRSVIKEAVEYFPRRLKISTTLPVDKDIFVSKERKAKFLEWFAL